MPALPTARDQYHAYNVNILNEIDKYLIKHEYERIEDQIHIKFTDELCKILTGMNIATLKMNSKDSIVDFTNLIISLFVEYVKQFGDSSYIYEVKYTYRNCGESEVAMYIVLNPQLICFA